MKKYLQSIIILSQKPELYKLRVVITFIFSAFISTLSFAQNIIDDDEGQCYFFNTTDYPFDATPSWGDDDWATNGITHDANHWYISSVEREWTGQTGSNNWIIWRIPVSEPLNQNFDNNSSVIKWQHKYYNPLKEEFTRYGHAGDIDHFVHDGIDYLIVPLTGHQGTKDSIDIYGGHHIVLDPTKPAPYPAIAFFCASNLHFVNYAYLDTSVIQTNTIKNQKDVGWCAYNPNDGYLYTSEDEAHALFKYEIKWNKILNPTNQRGLKFVGSDKMKDNGNTISIPDMQGGEFTSSGDLLYISSGIIGGCFGTTAHPFIDGIHVFTKSGSDWYRIQHSINADLFPSTSGGCFDYSFDSNNFCFGEEPEGLTVWEHAGLSIPNISGQLHVLMDDHNLLSSDRITIKHYKSFKCPDDITVYATHPTGESATNPQIANLLNQGSIYANCASIGHVNPTFFPAGITPVRFDVTDGSQVAVRCTSYVNVLNRHDQCSTALLLSPCDKVLVDNYCAGTSPSVPAISGYTGIIKDVWFKINKPNTPSFSIETYEVTNGVANTVMQLLSGTCGHFNEIASDDTSGDGDHAKITVTNYTGSWPLYVRVTDYGGNNDGQFGIWYKKIENGSNIFNGNQFISGDGNGVFQHPTLKGDVNGDGRTDLIFPYYDSNYGLTIRTKMGSANGDGTFIGYADTLGDGNGVFDHPTLTGDVNGDGKTDLIFPFYYANNGLTIRTKMADPSGNGTFIGYEDILGDANGVFEHPTLTGDVNGDGKTDLIFPFYYGNNGLTIRTKMADSSGNGTFIGYEDILGDANGVFEHPTLTGDVNGDGKTDLIFPFYYGNKGLTIRTKMAGPSGNGTFIGYQDILGDANGVFEHPTLTGDVNGDGKTDLIFPFNYGNNGLTIRTKMADSSGNGTFIGYQDILGDGNGVFDYPTLTSDINGDGKTDLIFVGQDWNTCGLNVRVKFSNGDGTWCEDWQGMGDGDGVQEYPTLTGDINNDGRTDLLFVFYYDSNGLTIRSKISLIDSCHQSISNQNFTNSQFLIFPNPTNGLVQIMTEQSQTLNVRILDITGMVLFSYYGINSARQLDLTSVSTGVYFIEIFDVNSGDRVVKRIVKIN